MFLFDMLEPVSCIAGNRETGESARGGWWLVPGCRPMPHPQAGSRASHGGGSVGPMP